MPPLLSSRQLRDALQQLPDPLYVCDDLTVHVAPEPAPPATNAPDDAAAQPVAVTVRWSAEGSFDPYWVLECDVVLDPSETPESLRSALGPGVLVHELRSTDGRRARVVVTLR
jgi:hypothetical protein